MRRAAARGLGPLSALLLLLSIAAAPAATGAPGRAGGLLQLVSQTPAVELGTDFVARVRVTSAPTTATLQVKVHDRSTTRSSFRDTLAGKGLAPVLRSTSVPVTPDTSGTVPITLGTRADSSGAADRLLIGPGVYPVEIALVDGRQVLDSMITYLIVLRPVDQGPPLGVGVVVPLGADAPPAHQADGTVALDGDAQRRLVETTTVLLEHPSVPVTLTAVPERVAALDGDQAKRALRSIASGRQVAPAPYVPVDAPSWLAAGLGNDLGSELDVGTESLRDSLVAPSSATWIAGAPIDATTARWLRARGASAVVVPEASLTELDARRFTTTLTQAFELDGVPGMRGAVADAGLAAHAGATGDAVLDANHLLADLAILDLDRPRADRAVFVQLPAATAPVFLDVLLAGLQATRTLQAGTADSLLASLPLAGARGETDGTGTPLVRSLVAPAPEGLGGVAARLREARDDVATYRSVLEPDDRRDDDLDVQALVAVDRALDRDTQLARLDAVRSRISGELAKVEAPPRQTITFTARDGAISVAVRNTTGYPVHVVLKLEGPRLELPGHADGRIPLTLSGDEQTTRVQIDVRARGSGDAALDLTLVTPDGRLTLGRTRFTVRSTAFSGVGIVLSIGALAFLLLWWGKHTLDARRARRRGPKHAARPAGEAG